jgi:hypothetical protein
VDGAARQPLQLAAALGPVEQVLGDDDLAAFGVAVAALGAWREHEGELPGTVGDARVPGGARGDRGRARQVAPRPLELQQHVHAVAVAQPGLGLGGEVVELGAVVAERDLAPGGRLERQRSRPKDTTSRSARAPQPARRRVAEDAVVELGGVEEQRAGQGSQHAAGSSARRVRVRRRPPPQRRPVSRGREACGPRAHRRRVQAVELVAEERHAHDALVGIGAQCAARRCRPDAEAGRLVALVAVALQPVEQVVAPDLAPTRSTSA